MKTKNPVALLIPSLLFPYIIVAVLGFFLTERYNDVIWDNLLTLGVGVLAFFVVAMAFNIIYMVKSAPITPQKALKTVFVIKCIHIPAYVFIFIIGLVLLPIFFMTLPALIILALLDYMALLLTSAVSVYALARILKQQTVMIGHFISSPLFASSSFVQTL